MTTYKLTGFNNNGIEICQVEKSTIEELKPYAETLTRQMYSVVITEQTVIAWAAN